MVYSGCLLALLGGVVVLVQQVCGCVAAHALHCSGLLGICGCFWCHGSAVGTCLSRRGLI
jgi:hypothetical protein